ncbi:MAG: Rne/Rng family ribonuclease [Firmicutes bacterium]|nr:Rne/Rng family ribonuclease [Bacillota bacterium]
MSVHNRELMVSVDDFETRAAVLEDRELVEIYLERREAPSIVGNIYLGRVKDILPGMQAAFIDIGIERNAFLYVEEIIFQKGSELEPAPPIQHLLKPGQDILVQVIKEPMDSKGARVTTQITLPGRYLVLLPYSDFVGASRRLPDEERHRLKEICEQIKPRGKGLIARTAAEGADLADLRADVKRLLLYWRKISRRVRESTPVQLIYQEPQLALRIVRDLFSSDFKRLVIDSENEYKEIIEFLKSTEPDLAKRVEYYTERLPLFDKYNINQDIENATKRKVWLRSGGYISIDHTEALTAIDVNTGKYVGKTTLEQTIFRTNLEAAEEIVRQLRLRDIGGIIVIDFIDMQDPANREEVSRVLSEALASDRTKNRVIEISKLGLVEMTRKNVSQGLLEFQAETCPCCHGLGVILSEATVGIQNYRQIKKIVATHISQSFIFKINPRGKSFLEQKGKLEGNVLYLDWGKKAYLIFDDTVPAGKPEMVEEGTEAEIERSLSNFY